MAGMTTAQFCDALRSLMAGFDAMQLKRAGIVVPGVTDSPLVAAVERLDAMGRILTVTAETV